MISSIALPFVLYAFICPAQQPSVSSVQCTATRDYYKTREECEEKRIAIKDDNWSGTHMKWEAVSVTCWDTRMPRTEEVD